MPNRLGNPSATVLVLVSGGTLDDLQVGGKLPAVRELAERGGIALLHNRVWGAFNENAAYLSIGSSERMAAPATGNLSLDSLRQFQPNVANRPAKVGALGKALAGKRVRLEDHAPPLGKWVVGDISQQSIPGNPDLLVIVTSSLSDCNTTVQRLLAQNPTGDPDIIVAAPYTPEIDGGGPYRRLGFVAILRPNIPPGSLLISPTTRTPGVVANVDIIPTIDSVAPISGAAGQKITASLSQTAHTWQTLTAIDRQTNAAARATVPVLAGYGIFAGVACLLALLALRIGLPVLVRTARFVLLIAASVLPALLVVGIIAPQKPLFYGGTLVGIAVAMSVLAQSLGKQLSIEPLRIILYTLIGIILTDSFLHLHLVERSLLSASTLTGIRFYGIGNEWFGLLLGAAIVCLVPWWLGILIVCADGLPYFGADAGGTLAATMAFAVLYFSQRVEKLKAKHIAGASGIAIAVTVFFALLDRLQPGTARSHVGAAVASGESASGLRALADIALRKIGMNVGLLLMPWTIVALVGMGIVGVWILRQSQSVDLLAKVREKDSFLKSVLPAAFWGGIVSLVFNDGGVAASLLLMVPVIVRFLDAVLAGTIERTQHAISSD